MSLERRITALETAKQLLELEREFKRDLLASYGFTEENDKADKAYHIAWGEKHAHGYDEVVDFFAELVELIK